jgi:hypothetical protein
VFCSDDAGLKQQLQDLIAREGLKNVVISLSANKTQGPPRYLVASESDLTVVIYENHNHVIANFVLESEDLTGDKTKDIMKALARVVP